MEADLVPYQAISCIDARHALVLAPHCDDEVFGCGGAIARHVQAGVAVSVIVLTDGALFGEASVREAESRRAAQILGYGEPNFWHLRDRGLGFSEDLIDRLVVTIDRLGIDLLYAPSPWEVHPDHRHTAHLALEAARRAGNTIRLAWYEVGAPLRPNVLVDITPVWSIKRQAMRCFPSQLDRQDYVRHISSLNEYRTYTLAPDVTFAEAFCVWTGQDLHTHRMGGGLDLVSTMTPFGAHFGIGRRKVSVLIRSVDRDSLYTALDSIAVQTYPNIEIIVASAVPGHRPLPKHCGPHPIRLLSSDTKLRRSACANRALDAATGDLLIFLDDDDWFLPSHVARLVSVFERIHGLLVAYTGIALVNEEGQPMGQVFDVPFDNLRLLSGNLMPLHSVLFSRALTYAGCRFDEQLDLYEDWDFWIQLSRQTVFAHLPGVSGVYRIHASSGIHDEPGPLGRPAQNIYGKWSSAITATEQGHLMRMVWASSIAEEEALRIWGEKDEILRHHRWLRDQLEDLVAEFESNASNRMTEDSVAVRSIVERIRSVIGGPAPLAQAFTPTAEELALRQITAMADSTSWRITQPFRNLANIWKQRRASKPWRLAQRVVQVYRQRRLSGVWRSAAKAAKSLSIVQGNTPDYPAWYEFQASQDAPMVAELTRRLEKAEDRPLISVIMPVFRPPLVYLDQAIQSVIGQLYTNWELCIADDASPDPAVMDRLNWWALQDSRIKVIGRPSNGHISEASNSALGLATGDYLALLDNDDILPRDALLWIADAIMRDPRVRILFSDEDKIDESGRRFGPYFKSDWNYSLFLGHNLISHLGVYQTALVREVGGFRKGLEGSQDYDLALRCIERIDPGQIVHIPRVLYHWRTLPGSTALAADEKPYALTSGQRALQEHLSRAWPGTRMEILSTWNYRCVPPATADGDVTLVLLTDKEPPHAIPPWINHPSTRRLVREVLTCKSESLDVIRTVTRAGTPLVALIDINYVPVTEDALEELAGIASRTRVAVTGGAIYDTSDHLEDGGLILNWDTIAEPMHRGVPISNNGYMGRVLLAQELSAVSLRCAIVHRNHFLHLHGSMDAGQFGRVASVECCVRLKSAGFATVWVPRSKWRHHGADDSHERDSQEHQKRISRLRTDFAQWLRHDPAYHPALNTARADFSLRPLPDGSGRVRPSTP